MLKKKRKSIPTKFLYDDLGSRLFEEISNTEEYYLTRTEKEILKKYSAKIDTASFGAPRESFRNVVGPTKFCYTPYKSYEPGPMNNGGGKIPSREIGSTQNKIHRYSMAGKHYTHSKYLLL